MKYLSLLLKGRWKFKSHFSELSLKLVGANAALERLLPNLGGLRSSRCQLYAGIILSMALCGAYIWLNGFNAAVAAESDCNKAFTRGYRTVSAGVACALAGTPPWDLEVKVLADIFVQRGARRAIGEDLLPREIKTVRRRAQEIIMIMGGEN